MINRRVIKHILLLLILSSAIVINSCSDDSVTNPPPAAVVNDLILLDSQYAIGARALVSIYVEDTLKVGYNNVYIVLTDSLTRATIEDAHVMFKLSDHGVGTPVEDPDETAVDGKFKGAWILNESQDADNPLHWKDSIFIHNHPPDLEGSALFGGFRVKENPDGFREITMPDSTRLYLSYISPGTPVNGMNDFEFIINRNEIGYAPDGSFNVEVTPEYLADGHNTSGNVNPTGSSNGHYNGRINLDQSGAWRLNLRVMKGTMHYDTYFDINY